MPPADGSGRHILSAGLPDHGVPAGREETVLERILLTPRLRAAAELVAPGARIADIGCDHAYLPIALTECGQIRSAIAADLRRGPLERAARNIRAHGLEESIRTVQSDGLEALSPGDFDTLVIAGMGGENILHIIERAPYLRNAAYHLILQPQSNADKLRAYLGREGFDILAERFACEEEKVYCILSVRFDGVPRELRGIERFVSPAAMRERPAHMERYLEKLAARFEKRRDGLAQADCPDVAERRAVEELMIQLRELAASAEREESI